MEVLGWGWVGTAKDTYASPGFVSFNCENITPGACPHEYNLTVDTEAGYVFGWAWAGSVAKAGDHALGWIQFSENPADYKNDCEEDLPSYVDTGALYSQSGEISGWARIYSLGLYGCEKFASNNWGWIKLRGDGYGVSLDKDYYKNQTPSSDYGKLTGWGFSAPTKGKGFGLVQFDAGKTGLGPWIQTQYGDVYSGNNINIPTPAGQVNASYLILSSGTVQDFSTNLSEGTMTGYDLPFPELNSGSYRSNIGKIDITSLKNRATEFFADTELDNRILAGDAYKYNGSFIIDNPITIPNGTGNLGDANALGNGTIIIDGDLIIDRNISYGGSSVTNLYNLASVAWIITGDLTITPNVTEIDGVYIVLGDAGVSTGEGNQPLVVNGLMMAKAFSFQRDRVKEADSDVPSEKIIYDGRALLNTPPGLEDLVATLPELKISTP